MLDRDSLRTTTLAFAALLATASGSSTPAHQPRQPQQPRQPTMPGDPVGPAAHGGGAPQLGVAPTPAPTPGGDLDAELQYCVDETNRYRKTLGLPALRRSPELEACAAAAAASDHRSQRPHGHFQDTMGCNIAFAENEIPWWSLDFGGSVRGTIRLGLEQMWGEGPGGGHYENMRGNYTELGCGIYLDASSITVVQNFR